jgi:hypothetical protein
MRSPRLNLLNPAFKYIPAAATDVAATWQRFGFDPRANQRRRLTLGPVANDMPGRDPEIAGKRASAKLGS